MNRVRVSLRFKPSPPKYTRNKFCGPLLRNRIADSAAALERTKRPSSSARAAKMEVHALACTAADARRTKAVRAMVMVTHSSTINFLHVSLSLLPFQTYHRKARMANIAAAPKGTTMDMYQPNRFEKDGLGGAVSVAWVVVNTMCWAYFPKSCERPNLSAFMSTRNQLQIAGTPNFQTQKRSR